jgi:hypothetical protein
MSGVPLEDEATALMDTQEPKRELEDLRVKVGQLYSGKYDQDVVKDICIRLRAIEAAVCKKYEMLPIEEKKGT